MNPKRIADLSVLLENNPLSFYWMGFLIADGHFTKTAIKLYLAEEDREQIEKFRKFVKYSGRAKKCCLDAMNPIVVKKITKKFEITNRKTYKPVPIQKIKNEKLLFSLIAGMLDGDGNIRTRNGTTSAFEMKLHGNWLPQLEFIENFLYDYLNITRKKTTKLARLKKNGYALLLFTDRELLAAMKKAVLQLQLPVMDRKWSGIDETYIGPAKKAEITKQKIISLLELGYSNKEIIQKTSLNKVTIYKAKKQWLRCG